MCPNECTKTCDQQLYSKVSLYGMARYIELCDHLITALAMMRQTQLEKISFYGTTITANIFHRAEIFAVPKVCAFLFPIALS